VVGPGATATALVGEAFDRFSSPLGRLASRAFDEAWVDAEMRDGKRSGAYCAGFGGDVSRVMMNFDGSLDAVSTLAHELGHAYHNTALAPRTPIQRRTPMALAETASIFCETLLFEAAVAGADDDARRLALLDTHLVGTTATPTCGR
jgi:oligoendopeptidase F